MYMAYFQPRKSTKFGGGGKTSSYLGVARESWEKKSLLGWKLVFFDFGKHWMDCLKIVFTTGKTDPASNLTNNGSKRTPFYMRVIALEYQTLFSGNANQGHIPCGPWHDNAGTVTFHWEVRLFLDSSD